MINTPQMGQCIFQKLPETVLGMNLSLSEQITYSTVRIECQYSNWDFGTGTGFFFRFLEDKENNTHVPVVITNKHVINGAKKGRLLFTKATLGNTPDDRNHFNVYIDNFEQYWRKHPSAIDFEERHKRVTLYLENDLYLLVQELRAKGEITNLTRFVNKAIMYYLGNGV